MITWIYLLASFLPLAAVEGDWQSDWTDTRSLLSAYDVDPLDSQCLMRGSGDILISNGTATFLGSPRLYVYNRPRKIKWENIEMTAYGKFVNDGTLSDSSGLTMAARSNHDLHTSDGCEAMGYYARIYRSTGECAFQKEYYHPAKGRTVYSPTKRVDCFPGGLPLGLRVGMRFTVNTVNSTQVVLKLYLDEVGNGSSWVLKHSYVDTPGTWFSTSSTTVPAKCPFKDGDTVLRPGNVCFLRTDGSPDTKVEWDSASIMTFTSQSSQYRSFSAPASTKLSLLFHFLCLFLVWYLC
jgi:hypothetical protein